MPSETTDGQARVNEQGSHAASPQTDTNAGKQTTTDRVKEQGSHATGSQETGKAEGKGLMDFLDIPAEVRSQIDSWCELYPAIVWRKKKQGKCARYFRKTDSKNLRFYDGS